jgi:heme oxygenase-like protein
VSTAIGERPVPGILPATALPAPRGPICAALWRLLAGEAVDADGPPEVLDPLADDDLHLALYLSYELHYRGLPGVSERLEWDPRVLAFRRDLETQFEDELRRRADDRSLGAADVREALRRLAAPPTEGSLSTFVEQGATIEQVREFLIHRSAYQLKEADPHSWGIPRLTGASKTGLMEIQYDEYGSGDPAWMHAELFRATMVAAGLDGTYGAYVDLLPGTTLATVNLISLFGLHRRLRGALVGHLALFEMTSSLPNRAYANGLRRLGFGEPATRFFDEHVEADALHEVLAEDLAALLATDQPALAGDVVFGATALSLVEDRSSGAILDAWGSGRSSLLAASPTGR